MSLERGLPDGAMSPKRQDGTLFACGFEDVDGLEANTRALLAVREEEIQALSECDVVSGHFSLSTLRRVTGDRSVATVLREPRARLLSHYAFWRVSSGLREQWRGYPALDHALRPLDEFLAEPLIAKATDNLVCRMLLDDAWIPACGFIAAEDVSEIAEQATAVLDRLGYVGVLELGDSVWRGLSQFFGVTLCPTHVNTTASQRDSEEVWDADVAGSGLEITASTLELLEARTAADAIVYRHALVGAGCSAARVEQRCAVSFAQELARVGDVLGTFASGYRSSARTIAELEQQLQRARVEASTARADASSARTEASNYRAWLEGIKGSTSWRATAPARAAKARLLRIRPRDGRRTSTNGAGTRP